MNNTQYKKSFHLKLQETSGLTVYNTGEQQCPPGYSCGSAVWEYYLMHFVVSGKGTYTTQGKTHHLSTGDAFMIFPSEISEYKADPQNPWQYCWVAFNGADAKRLISLTNFSKDNPISTFDCQSSKKIYRHISNIYSGVGSSTQSEVFMVGHLYLLLSDLIGMSNTAKTESSTAREYLKLGLKFIQNNYNRKIAVENIASYVKISPSHLYRIFIQEQGVSPNRYLTEYRINHACTLIRKGDYTISEIANSVGFEDPLYFSRVFKKVKAVSPSQYKMEHMQSTI